MSKKQPDKANHEQPHQTVEIDDLPLGESKQNQVKGGRRGQVDDDYFQIVTTAD